MYISVIELLQYCVNPSICTFDFLAFMIESNAIKGLTTYKTFRNTLKDYPNRIQEYIPGIMSIILLWFGHFIGSNAAMLWRLPHVWAIDKFLAITSRPRYVVRSYDNSLIALRVEVQVCTNIVMQYFISECRLWTCGTLNATMYKVSVNKDTVRNTLIITPYRPWLPKNKNNYK